MNITTVVFDLDGTLMSSHKTIYQATIKTLAECNYNVDLPEDQFYTKIGMHFEDIFSDFGFVVDDFDTFITKYKSIYFEYIDLSEIYPNVIDIINYLYDNKYNIALLTTKAQDQADLILKHFGLADKFTYIMGRRPGLAHKPSPEPLLYILKELDTLSKNCLMVGDSELDILCGRDAGAFTIGVSYGYRSSDILKSYNPDFLLDDISQLKNILKNETSDQS
ncbi:MAG: HAD family hydrolase [Melioribacteraceae bacterium]|nr:HAD family hydrolase [Melioribacteraceae bacterium]